MKLHVCRGLEIKEPIVVSDLDAKAFMAVHPQ
jgi:hypothetical protein